MSGVLIPRPTELLPRSLVPCALHKMFTVVPTNIRRRSLSVRSYLSFMKPALVTAAGDADAKIIFEICLKEGFVWVFVQRWCCVRRAAPATVLETRVASVGKNARGWSDKRSLFCIPK